MIVKFKMENDHYENYKNIYVNNNFYKNIKGLNFF